MVVLVGLNVIQCFLILQLNEMKAGCLSIWNHELQKEREAKINMSVQNLQLVGCMKSERYFWDCGAVWA
jgi:hypothetical protein